MCRNAARLVLSLALLAAIPGGADSGEIKQVRLQIQNRQLSETGETVRLSQGDRIELHWVSDEPAELHLHGYDITLKVVPGKTGVMALAADVPGRFPVTAHGLDGGHGHQTLIYLEIYPE